MEGNCALCTGLCCRYFAITIRTPRNYEDYDELWWAMMHQPVEVYAEDVGTPEEAWTMRVPMKCEHLTEENRCGFYEKRPNVCREYGVDECEMSDAEDEPVDFWFETAEEFRRHCVSIGVSLTGKHRGKVVKRRRPVRPLPTFST